MEKQEVSITQYNNAIVAKAKNKRIVIAKEEENVLVEFVHFNTLDEFKVVGHKKLRKNLHVNALKLTRHSAEILMLTLGKFLQEFELENA